VPEVTLYFWIVKVLCTTVGATASAFLASNVGLGLTQTTYITVALSLATVIVQFTRLSRSPRGVLLVHHALHVRAGTAAGDLAAECLLLILRHDFGCLFRFLSGRRTDHGNTPVRGVTS
jgi:uncharacterized membrane-anchored protein